MTFCRSSLTSQQNNILIVLTREDESAPNMQAAIPRGRRVEAAGTPGRTNVSDPLAVSAPLVIDLEDESETEDSPNELISNQLENAPNKNSENSASTESSIAIVNVFSQAIVVGENGTQAWVHSDTDSPNNSSEETRKAPNCSKKKENNTKKGKKLTKTPEKNLKIPQTLQPVKQPFEILASEYLRQLKEKIDELKATEQKLKLANEKIKEYEEKSEMDDSMWHDQQEEIRQWNIKLDEEQKKNLEMQEEKIKSDILIKKANNKINELNTQLEIKDKKLSSNTTEINILHENNSDLEIKLKDSEKKILSLKEEYKIDLQIEKTKNTSLEERMKEINLENKQIVPLQLKNEELKRTVSGLKLKIAEVRKKRQEDKNKINRLEDLILILPMPAETAEERKKDETANQIEKADSTSKTEYHSEKKTVQHEEPTFKNPPEPEDVLIMSSDPEQHTLTDPDSVLPDIEGFMAELLQRINSENEIETTFNKTEQPEQDPEKITDNNIKSPVLPAVQYVSTRPKRQSAMKPVCRHSCCMGRDGGHGLHVASATTKKRKQTTAELPSGDRNEQPELCKTSDLSVVNGKKTLAAKKRKQSTTTCEELTSGGKKEKPDLGKPLTPQPSPSADGGDVGRPKRQSQKPPCRCCIGSKHGHDHDDHKETPKKDAVNKNDSKAKKMEKPKSRLSKPVLPPSKAPGLDKSAGKATPKKRKSESSNKPTSQTKPQSQVSDAEPIVEQADTPRKKIKRVAKPVARALPQSNDDAKNGGAPKKTMKKLRLNQVCPEPPTVPPVVPHETPRAVPSAVPLAVPKDSEKTSQIPPSTCQVLPSSEVPNAAEVNTEQKDMVPPEETSKQVLPPSQLPNIVEDNSDQKDVVLTEEKPDEETSKQVLPPSEVPNIVEDNSDQKDVIPAEKKQGEESSKQVLPSSEQVPNIVEDNSDQKDVIPAEEKQDEESSKQVLPPNQEPNIVEENSDQKDETPPEQKSNEETNESACEIIE